MSLPIASPSVCCSPSALPSVLTKSCAESPGAFVGLAGVQPFQGATTCDFECRTRRSDDERRFLGAARCVVAAHGARAQELTRGCRSPACSPSFSITAHPGQLLRALACESRRPSSFVRAPPPPRFQQRSNPLRQQSKKRRWRCIAHCCCEDFFNAPPKLPSFVLNVRCALPAFLLATKVDRPPHTATALHRQQDFLHLRLNQLACTELHLSCCLHSLFSLLPLTPRPPSSPAPACDRPRKLRPRTRSKCSRKHEMRRA